MAKSISKNATFVFADRVCTAAIGIFLTPFIIRTLGPQVYGLWVLFQSVSSYFLLAQFGLGSAIFKYVAELFAKKAYEELIKLITTSFYLLMGISVAALLLMLALSIPALRLIVGGPINHTQMTAFIVLNVSISISILDCVFVSVPQGFQRFGSISGISIVCRICLATMICGSLVLHFELMGLAVSTLSYTILLLISHIFLCTKVVPGFSLNYKHFNIYYMKTMFGFGSKLQVSIVSTWVAQNFDKLLLGRFLGPSFVAYYDIGARLVVVLRELPMFLFGVLIPRISAMCALGEKENIRNLYFHGTKYFAAFIGIIIGVLVPLAGPLLSIWLQKAPNALSIYTFQILVVGAMAALITGVGGAVGQGIGKPQFEAISNTVAISVNISISSLLFFAFGFKGVVFGTFCSYFAHLLIFNSFINREYSIKSQRFWIEVLLQPILVAVFGIFIGIEILRLFPLWFIKSGFLISNIRIVISHICFTVVVSMVFYIVTRYISLKKIFFLLRK